MNYLRLSLALLSGIFFVGCQEEYSELPVHSIDLSDAGTAQDVYVIEFDGTDDSFMQTITEVKGVLEDMDQANRMARVSKLNPETIAYLKANYPEIKSISKYKTAPGCLTDNYSDHYLLRYHCTKNELEQVIVEAGGQLDRAHDEIGLAKVSGFTEPQVRALKKSNKISAVIRDIDVHWLGGGIDQVQDIGAIGRGKSSIEFQNPLLSSPSKARYYNLFQWGKKQMHAEAAWEIEQGNENVKVAIVDTGISPTHSDLIERYDLPNSINFSSADPGDYIDRHEHGTYISGIVSTNNIYIAGMAPGIQMVGIKVLDDEGYGNFADLIAGILHAVSPAKVDIINISFGSLFPAQHGQCEDLKALIKMLETSIQYAVNHDVLVVSAAGNDGVNQQGYNLDQSFNYIHLPSQLSNVLSVNATAPINRSFPDSLTSYANFGYKGASISAPGGNNLSVTGGILFDKIISTLAPAVVPGGARNRYGWSSGTGISAAQVSGIAALVDSQHGGTLDGKMLTRIILNSADDIGPEGRDIYHNYGRANAYNALTWSNH